MLYHISKIAGLKILKPQVSTHKKAYVYAIENVVTGLLFGAPHDDFDFIISEENGIISTAANGVLRRYLTPERLFDLLYDPYRSNEDDHRSKKSKKFF